MLRIVSTVFIGVFQYDDDTLQLIIGLTLYRRIECQLGVEKYDTKIYL